MRRTGRPLPSRDRQGAALCHAAILREPILRPCRAERRQGIVSRFGDTQMRQIREQFEIGPGWISAIAFEIAPLSFRWNTQVFAASHQEKWSTLGVAKIYLGRRS